MAFSYDPATARGRVRLKIADTNTADAAKQIFTDAEIDAFLALEQNEILGAAAAACEAIAASTGRSAIAYRAVGPSIDKTQVPKHYLELAQRYRAQGVDQAPHEEIDQLAYDIGIHGDDRSEYVGDPIT